MAVGVGGEGWSSVHPDITPRASGWSRPAGGELDTIPGKPHYGAATEGSYPGHLSEMPEDCQRREPWQRKATLGPGPGPGSDWSNVFSCVSFCLSFPKGKWRCPASGSPHCSGLVCGERREAEATLTCPEAAAPLLLSSDSAKQPLSLMPCPTLPLSECPVPVPRNTG